MIYENVLWKNVGGGRENKVGPMIQHLGITSSPNEKPPNQEGAKNMEFSRTTARSVGLITNVKEV